MGDSMAIIEAEGAAGTKVSNQDVEVNNRGYALYPYISPYNANVINMDVNTLPNDVLLRETSKTVYPAAGAIVKVKFDTKVGYQAVINLKSMVLCCRLGL
ncbi:fimbria/pilus outer membrane usher protein [Providencia hangzhouensis]